jgi:hypothetical protein
VRIRADADSTDPDRVEQDALVGLLPAVYVAMPEEKEEQAVAAVAGLLGLISDRSGGMALTSTGTWRSGLDETGPRPRR